MRVYKVCQCGVIDGGTVHVSELSELVRCTVEQVMGGELCDLTILVFVADDGSCDDVTITVIGADGAVETQYMPDEGPNVDYAYLRTLQGFHAEAMMESAKGLN